MQAVMNGSKDIPGDIASSAIGPCKDWAPDRKPFQHRYFGLFAGRPLSALWLGAHLCLLVLLIFTVSGCATAKTGSSQRRFNFEKDTFSYANGLVWEYRFDENGKWTTRRREPPPRYSQHCFVVSRSACQFFENASFHPELPKADEQAYARIIRRVIGTSLRQPLPEADKIVVPGYEDLRSFSTDHEKLLQGLCGGAWRCYFQRGNWRVVFPFSRGQQSKMAERIQDELRRHGAVVVHLIRFPQLSINHAVLIFGCKLGTESIEFDTYDPNDPSRPVTITYDRSRRTFTLPTNSYFYGGRVDVYSIYDRALY